MEMIAYDKQGKIIDSKVIAEETGEGGYGHEIVSEKVDNYMFITYGSGNNMADYTEENPNGNFEIDTVWWWVSCKGTFLEYTSLPEFKKK